MSPPGLRAPAHAINYLPVSAADGLVNNPCQMRPLSILHPFIDPIDFHSFRPQGSLFLPTTSATYLHKHSPSSLRLWPNMFGLTTLSISVLAIAPAILAFEYEDYDSDFLNPSYILAKNFPTSTAAAQQPVVEWADYLAAQGPWCE